MGLIDVVIDYLLLHHHPATVIVMLWAFVVLALVGAVTLLYILASFLPTCA